MLLAHKILVHLPYLIVCLRMLMGPVLLFMLNLRCNRGGNDCTLSEMVPFYLIFMR